MNLLAVWILGIKEELHALFFELRDQMNQTFVIVTHDEQLASQTDRTIHIRDGVVSEEASITE